MTTEPNPLDHGDPFCLWCSRLGRPSPHAHESDDHTDADDVTGVRQQTLKRGDRIVTAHGIVVVQNVHIDYRTASGFLERDPQRVLGFTRGDGWDVVQGETSSR